MEGRMILGKNQIYSLDCYETQLNNNVIVVGASGSGKTRSVVIPNVLEATGSYVISDPKGNLYKKCSKYLKDKGYKVKKLDFIKNANSNHYNFFHYIHSTRDIVKIAHYLMTEADTRYIDPFWTEAGELLLQSIMAYMYETYNIEDCNLGNMLKLISKCQVDDNDASIFSELDRIIRAYGLENPESFAVNQYEKFRIAAGKTLKSILITVNAKLGIYDIPEIRELTKTDDLGIDRIGEEKTALFVMISDTDRSLDGLSNIFFTQVMNELCSYADDFCPNQSLPLHVRFILDDFATNCKIYDFPKMISSIRSRNISAIIIIQSEAQLKSYYWNDDKTILSNCDTYLYLGCNDVDTAVEIAKRVNTSLSKILYMPVGTNWLFRRGQEPINGTNYEIEFPL